MNETSTKKYNGIIIKKNNNPKKCTTTTAAALQTLGHENGKQILNPDRGGTLTVMKYGSYTSQ